jgi:asparagine synthase (glutamine-hydrolysing)
MCGIAGFLDDTLATAPAAACLADMLERIAHRGPDGSGTWREGPVSLGHRRLAILELSPLGHQPMVSGSGRYVITFNGEIYNHDRLRAKLREGGVTFRGHSDTEVLLALIEQLGLRRALERCVGMFALALWDRHERVLKLARDRFGEKPLFYGWYGGRFVFGSELGAVRAHPAFQRDLDRQAISELLTYGYVAAPRCIFQNTWKVPPAAILTLALPGAGVPLGAAACQQTIEPYWSALEVALRGRERPFAGSLRDATDELEALLTDSVSLQMQADVPLGAFLSGGIDSSTIVALMQKQTSRRVKTFAIGFDVARFNEAEHAAAVAKHLGTDHTELYVSERDSLDVIPTLPGIYDEPLGDSSQIPTLVLARLARRQVTVALSGDGGDEMFGGYPRYELGNRLSRLPLRPALGVLARMAPEALVHLAWGAVSSRVRRPDGRAAVRRYLELLGARGDDALVDRLAYAQTPPAALYARCGTRGELAPATLDYPARAMLDDRTRYLPDDLLVKTDRACMAVALEGRAPLLDHRIAELASTFPHRLLVEQATQKVVLREVLYRHVPRPLVDRPKAGFTIPLTDWFRSELRGPLEDVIADSAVEAELGLDRKVLRRLLGEHVNRRGDWSILLWTVWSLVQWNRSSK